MSDVIELTEDTFETRATQAGITVIDFWAPWCGPCRAMAPQYERAAGLRPQHTFAKVNVDENPRLAGAFGVQAIPTLAILKDGELLGTAPGVVGSDQLVSALDRIAEIETAQA